MKILIEGRDKTKLAPKRKIKWCSRCGSLLLIERGDCYEAETVIGVAAWGAKCPVCDEALNVGGR